jgi:hypothetical protein
LIERDNRISAAENGLFDSGFWVVSERAAQRLAGGDIFFHQKQRSPSHGGGVIIGDRESNPPEFPDRIMIKFRRMENHKAVDAGRDGWSRERKLVLHNPRVSRGFETITVEKHVSLS